MIFLTEQLLKDNKTFLNLIDDEITLVNAYLKSQRVLKNSLLEHMQELTTTTNINKTNSSKILNVLLSYKNSLELSNNNISSLEKLLDLLKEIKKMNNETIINKLSELNLEIVTTNENLAKNEQEILQTLKLTIDTNIEEELKTNESSSTISETATAENLSNNSDSKKDSTEENSSENSNSLKDSTTNESSNETNFSTGETPNETISTTDEVSNNENSTLDTVEIEATPNETKTEEKTSAEINSSETSTVENNINETSNSETTTKENSLNQTTRIISEPISIQENTLVISEKAKKVFLPYNVSSLETLYKNNPNKYSCIEDIIREDYTLPLENFKIPSFSRFRESFKLMKEKENKTFKESFDLALELFFNYNLHPAIISACKNLDELDIYLDYLSNNETHKFNCFNVVFEVAPTTISKHSMRRKLD